MAEGPRRRPGARVGLWLFVRTVGGAAVDAEPVLIYSEGAEEKRLARSLGLGAALGRLSVDYEAAGALDFGVLVYASHWIVNRTGALRGPPAILHCNLLAQ